MINRPAVFFAICPVPLDVAACELFIRSAASGGEVIFSGVVRADNRHRQVVQLEFEAYEPMVQKQLQQITREIKNRWNPDAVLFHHRTGIVKPGEIAVVAAIAARHRKEAFAACTFLMDEIKRAVPIWKKEIFTDGAAWVSTTP